MVSDEDVELEHLVKEFPDENIIVIGVAHGSDRTSQLAYDVIVQTDPDVVAFESCLTRLESRQQPGSTTVPISISSRWQQFKAKLALRVVDVTSSGSALFDEEQKIGPSSDFEAAFRGASQVNANIGLIDRGLKTTLDRFVATVSWREIIRLGLRGLFNPITSADVSSADTVESFDERFNRYSAYSQTFIHERDDVMAYSLLSLASEDTHVVGVVGAGHLTGIEHRIRNPNEISEENQPEIVDLVPVAGMV